MLNLSRDGECSLEEPACTSGSDREDARVFCVRRKCGHKKRLFLKAKHRAAVDHSSWDGTRATQQSFLER